MLWISANDLLSRICHGGHLARRYCIGSSVEGGYCHGCREGQSAQTSEPAIYVTAHAQQKVTGKLLDLSLAPGGEGMGGEGAEAWMGGGGEKIFLLNKCVVVLSKASKEVGC